VVAAERVVIVHEGGTPWWVPLIVGLVIASVAAIVSYLATWLFKKRDVDRENAFLARDFVDEAEQISERRERFEAEGGVGAVFHLLQQARVRAEPLESPDLSDRFLAALHYGLMFGTWHPQPPPPGARRWLGEAVANIREGLKPYLAAPRFIGFRGSKADRSFPRLDELRAMPQGADAQELLDALEEWKEARKA
jgi:hypothetical protein